MGIAKKAEKGAGWCRRIGEGIASLGKVMLMSGKPSAAGEPKDKPLVIMGNGPSLREALDYGRKILKQSDLLAVNFAPNSDEFFDFRPGQLVLADPHFFIGSATDENVARLWRRLGQVDWPLTLHVPAQRRLETLRLLGTHPQIRVRYFNMTPVEGGRRLRHWLFRRGLGMPRPRNVLIPSLMIALREGYRDIRIVGADHSWSRTLWVDDMNRVISVQPHFYKEHPDEQERVAREYAGYHLHDIYQSLAIAFRSYFDIRDYAATLGARIVNATPGSFIDAFERGRLEDFQ
ncbi:MAG: hypothetical protein HDS26_06615 [Bacteroides sp.]|nr:hypothetical protein [Bacteroides sp.]MBD5307141.1 hypothetical protein [Bacteroides sp.]